MERDQPLPRHTAGPIYFGWRVVAAMFLCVAALLGVAMYAFIMFAKPLSDQFGWSSMQTGSLVSAMWLVGPLALVAAPAAERLGAWRLVVAGMLLQVIVLAAMPAVTAFWQLYLLRLVMGLGKILVMTAMPSIIARWFEARFATAMSIAWAGGAAGGIIMAPVAERLTTGIGWKASAIVLAAGLLIVTAIAAWIGRGAAAPAQLGLGRDGAPLRGGPEAALERAEEASGAIEAPPPRSLDIRVLAPMCLAVVGACMVSISVQSQEPALFQAIGMSSSVAAGLLGLTAGAALVGSIAIGWLLDRAPPVVSSVCVVGAMATGLGAFLSLSQGPGLPLGVIGAACAGFAFGGGEVLWIALFKRQFGPGAFAASYGLFYFSLQLGFASGGLIGGWSLERFGVAGFSAGAALMYLPAAFLSFWRPRPASPAGPAAGRANPSRGGRGE